jgi:predicted 3-demethylubiquinone-9 3-methyltransferase (glyoxalase superfamily)
MSLGKITPFLWYDSEAEEAANFYVSIFPNSSIKHVVRSTGSGQEFHHREEGSVMVVKFELDGHPFVAMNGGPHVKFNEAVSFQVDCKDQEELDYFHEKLGESGDPKKQQCGR